MQAINNTMGAWAILSYMKDGINEVTLPEQPRQTKGPQKAAVPSCSSGLFRWKLTRTVNDPLLA